MPEPFRNCHALIAILFLLATSQWTRGEDLRVYTTVTDLSQGTGQSEVVAHSLTLFHAGKVYDYMEESGELVVFEPTSHRFIILNKDFAAAEISFSELNHFLETARRESLRYVQDLSVKQDAVSQRVAESIRFQLQPTFQVELDPTKMQLSLNGGPMTYNVKVARSDSPTMVQQYLEYADWAARLNYILHPHAFYPEARLQLNHELHQRQLLPVDVELTMRGGSTTRLRAEHSFTSNFQSADRQHISHWERTLNSKQVRWLTIHEYQQQSNLSRR